jgi:outer membrane cobalamin receptor
MPVRASLIFAVVAVAYGQMDTGELRLTVTDSSGLPVQARAEITSKANDYDQSFDADAQGHIVAKRLHFGFYTVNVARAGLAPASQQVNIQSALPQELKIVLGLEEVRTSVTINSDQALVNPESVDAPDRIGAATIEDRLTAAPGRSLAELVNQEPGWLLEANGALHPRGEEYQTQYVVDGLPLTEQRSAAFVPDFDVDDVQEMSILTAGFPAEYGRRLGGVIEVKTQRDTRRGFHGKVIASGGSFDSANSYIEGQYGWKSSIMTLSVSGATTDRYLDPPVLQNYTNHGTVADFTGHYEKDLTDKDRFGIVLRRDQAKFLVPDEIVQEMAGQRQDRDSFESAALLSYQHIFSPKVLGDFRASVRDLTAGLWSNDLSTPILASQDRAYHEEYVKGTISVDAGINQFKTGVESDYASIQEALSYLITDPTQFDPDTPPAFTFYGHAPDREQGVFGQDHFHWRNLTIDAGIRFDHYDFLVNQTGWSPRLGAAYYWPWTKIVFRAAYDRIFQTPAFENLLVSSSPQVTSLSDQVLRLPVQPARGNYYQAGFARGFFGNLQFKTNFYWRSYSNYPDDDLLLNTGVSFPIAFAKADIYGVEAKLEIPRWGPFSGYISYANMRGNGYFPVTGGLFLGDNAVQAISATSGVFPVSQDQRNTVRARLRYDITRWIWAAVGGDYDSGLPIDFDGTYAQAAQEYGQAILNRVNFSDYRPRPLLSLDASLGIILHRSEKHSARFQIDGTNLTNEINVIDFAGLFSGTAIGPPRSVNARVQFGF